MKWLNPFKITIQVCFLRALVSFLFILFSISLLSAQTKSTDATPEIQQNNDDEIGSLFPHLDRPLSTSHFTWGTDVGGSIDLGGSDMSSFDIDANFGYKGNFIRNAAVGAGIHKAFGNQYTFIPVFALLRTSFRSKPSLLFLELKAGYSFNTLSDSGSQGGLYTSVGIGFNLATSRLFKSHIILSYGYFGLKRADDIRVPYDGNCINYAVLHFGVSF